jgi:hypothetical protein
LKDSYAYRDSVYNALTDASGAEVIDITREGGRQTRLPRMGLLLLNLGHNDEVWQHGDDDADQEYRAAGVGTTNAAATMTAAECYLGDEAVA